MESIRRISATLFVLSALVAGITILASFAVSCPVGTSCLGAVFSYENGSAIFSNTTEGSTLSVLGQEDVESDFAILNRIIQSVSIYLLLFTAIVLIALELKELHYLKELTIKRRKRKA